MSSLSQDCLKTKKFKEQPAAFYTNGVFTDGRESGGQGRGEAGAVGVGEAAAQVGGVHGVPRGASAATREAGATHWPVQGAVGV